MINFVKTFKSAENSNITSKTDPKIIKVVGDAVLYILRSHDIDDVDLKDIINNTREAYDISKDDALQMVSEVVLPDSIELFDPFDKGYGKSLLNWSLRASKKMNNHNRHNVDYMDLLLTEGKNLFYNVINVIDSRNCEEGLCPNTIYMVKNDIKTRAPYNSKVMRELCGDSPLICKKVIGAVQGFFIKDI